MITAVDYDSLAADAAANWQKFDSFGWHESPDDAEQYTIVYTSNRDSDTLAKANAESIAKELEGLRGVIPQTHSHWAVGHVEGFAIKVYTKAGKVTAAFRKWCDLQARLEDYPILDEELFSRLECEAQDESWDSWARRDFVKGVEKLLGVELDDSDSEGALHEIFSKVCDRSNTYWEGDSIRLERVIDATTCDDVRDLIRPVVFSIFCDGFYFVGGEIVGDEFTCNIPLYDDEFAACINAQESGAESVTINGKVFTWRAE